MKKIFKIQKKCGKTKARTGELTLPNGKVKTPVFMPIGTLGTVKSLTKLELEKLESEIILGNTYHLWLKPGMDVIEKADGLHKFNTWKRPILTDSGGFQAFSLGNHTKFTEEGVKFQDPKSGSLFFLSPEKSMQIQNVLGSDIALTLDQCLPAEVDEKTAKRAMDRTWRWAERCKKEWDSFNTKNLLFGIPQGAQFINLREESAKMTIDLDFPGYSIGGVANGGEPEEIMYRQVLSQTDILEEEKPKHLLGVGTPKDIVQMVARGIDMFDCVYPTRNARHGSIIFELNDDSYEIVQISGKRFEDDFSPINPASKFEELQTYSKAYLRHLFKVKEPLALRLATLQNLEFYLNLMKKIRRKIEEESFDSWWESYERI